MGSRLCNVCGKKVNLINSYFCSPKCRIIDGSEINKNGCWIWKLGKGRGNYGKVTWKSKTYAAHRFSFLAFKGEISHKMQVCHSCDNPSCVNPDHLWLGTQKDNIRDAKLKKRLPPQFGEYNPAALLNWKVVNEIREKLKKGIIGKVLAQEYCISEQTVSFIKNNKIWKITQPNEA